MVSIEDSGRVKINGKGRLVKRNLNKMKLLELGDGTMKLELVFKDETVCVTIPCEVRPQSMIFEEEVVA